MRKSLLLLLLLTVLVFLLSCSAPFERKIDNIARVFWHEGHNYSFYVQQEGISEIKIIEFYRIWKVKIIADVPADKKMWAHIKGASGGCDGLQYEYAEIHIHTAKDISGGGWNHGKFGSGQTHVIE